jgi:uncharacterized protein YkwD
MKAIWKWIILIIELILLLGLILNFLRTTKLVDVSIPTFENEITEYIPELPTPTLIPTTKLISITIPTVTIKVTPVPTKKPVITNNSGINSTEPWGVAKQVNDLTWTMKVGDDEKMATPKEILTALNEYRRIHGSQSLTWNEKLASFAQQRAQYLNSIKSVDQHAGFKNFLEKEDGFNKLGFTSIGENISFGYRLNGVHIIEWVYAGDKPHNDNQLNTKWDNVGIGIDGLATCLIFGTGKF